ncbi:prepilin peptidase [uncultured Roseobacter sp.]|uniref:prepilin peptidase n=1 Tax=uncultured Roseobacter sp. TaxID=114847 RepID=UPI00260BA260|nr:prepilin peptidase [uncultured Roseobacter sp.]
MIASPDAVQVIATLWLMVILGWISLWDISHLRIPDLANGLLVLSGLMIAAVTTGGWPISQLIGLTIGFAVFTGLGEVYFRRTGVDGLGLGDAKLLAAAGAWLGWAALPGLVALSALSALSYALILKRQRLAFGPWLSASFLLQWCVQTFT